VARAITAVQNIISIFILPRDGTTIPLSHSQPSPAVLTGVKRPASHKLGLCEEDRAKPRGFMHPQSNCIHLRAGLGAKASRTTSFPLTWKNRVVCREQEECSAPHPTADQDLSWGLTSSNTLWDNGSAHLPWQSLPSAPSLSVSDQGRSQLL